MRSTGRLCIPGSGQTACKGAGGYGRLFRHRKVQESSGKGQFLPEVPCVPA